MGFYLTGVEATLPNNKSSLTWTITYQASSSGDGSMAPSKVASITGGWLLDVASSNAADDSVVAVVVVVTSGSGGSE